MSEMNCKTCRFFVRETEPAWKNLGECHRYPPTVVLHDVSAEVEGSIQRDIQHSSVFAIVNQNDFCGEWRSKVAAGVLLPRAAEYHGVDNGKSEIGS